MPRRFALYWAPDDDSPLGEFGRRWLGRDARTGARLQPPGVAGLSQDHIADITSEPRRYGFHATLKPPFVLSQGAAADDLYRELAAFGVTRAGVDIPGLKLADLGGFLALVPIETPPGLTALADDCVRALDHLRAPTPEAELARRRKAGLTERQETYLQRWGYPYVFEEFRFHLTLTRRLGDDDRRVVANALGPVVAGFEQSTFRIAAVTVFEQPDVDAEFRAVLGIDLTGPRA